MDIRTMLILIIVFQLLTFILTLIIGWIVLSNRKGTVSKNGSDLTDKLTEKMSKDKNNLTVNPYVFSSASTMSKQVLRHKRIILECKPSGDVEDVGTFNESIISSTNATCKLSFGELEARFVGFVPLGEVKKDRFFIILEIKRNANPADIVSEFVSRKVEDFSIVTIQKFEEGEDLSWLSNLLSS